MTDPASSSSFCPGCGKPIDALRAGQVAILDGQFRYFCNAKCKEGYVEVVSKKQVLDVAVTAAPPEVSVRTPMTPIVVDSGVRAREDSAEERERERDEQQGTGNRKQETGNEPEREEQATGNGQQATGNNDDDDDDALALGDGEDDGDRESPLTLRSPEVAGDEAGDEPVVPRKRRPLGVIGRALAALPIVGISAGVLTPVVGLGGEAIGVVRLPFALFAAAVALARLVRVREDGDPASFVTGLPVAAGAVIAAVSTILHAPRADSHASFVGLAAAAVLVVDILITRAKKDVEAARQRIAEALDVTARVLPSEEIVDAAIVRPGQQVLVEVNETIPVDGTVTNGEAEVAPWLDSPLLVKKGEGDPVVAGAVVMSGRLRVNATFTSNERAWLRLNLPTPARIEVAAPLVAFARRMLGRGAPIAALLVGVAIFANNGSWLDVAIAACGGGFALAVVASVAASALTHARGHVAAQKRGIVYKDAPAFDAAARADIAVVCSRGTILLGEPEIVAVESITKDGITKSPADVERVLAVAAGAEMSSTHPFAGAILHEARSRGIRPEPVKSAIGHSGLGVTALAANGDRVIVGSRAFLLQEKVSVAMADARASELEAEGRSVLLVATNNRLCGLLALQDGLRPGARAAVQRLHDARIEPVLLSGEARDTVETIARALDIEHVRPEILPSDRGAEVRALADGGHIVAALGHASTDDGALGAADLSIAMEAAGAAPGEWGVALASDDVRDAALALTIPRACRERARTAVVVGGLTHALGVLGVAFGIAPPAIVPVLSVLGAIAVIAVLKD